MPDDMQMPNHGEPRKDGSNEPGNWSQENHSSVPGNDDTEAKKTAYHDPLLPALQSHHMPTPPQQFFSEDLPLARTAPLKTGRISPASAEASQHSFAEQANVLINESLGRDSEGSSVIEPDSVLGESGRLYHGYQEGKYFLPNDAAEQDRLDFQHRFYETIFDGWLSLAPMQFVPNYVLDIGTGTGIWAIEFAERYPTSYVVGTDLSRIQAQPRVPNCTFVKDDAETSEWVFALPTLEGHVCHEQDCEHRITFEYIHLRAMCSCFDDPRVVLRHAFENLTPGGWIEIQDATFEIFQANPLYQESAVCKWSEGCIRGAAAMGRDILVAKRYKKWLEEIGFTDVKERKFFAPCSPWVEDPKLRQIGHYQLRNMHEGARGIGWKMLRASGMEPDDIELLISQMKTESVDRRNQPYSYIYAIIGQKPLNQSAEPGSGSIAF